MSMGVILLSLEIDDLNNPGITAFACPYLSGSINVDNGVIWMRAILDSWRQAGQGPES